ncbi:MAG: hypothetical protein SGPRY_007242, partial [Prymnesium sp.]
RAAKAVELQRIEALKPFTKYSELVNSSNSDLSDQLKNHKIVCTLLSDWNAEANDLEDGELGLQRGRNCVPRRALANVADRCKRGNKRNVVEAAFGGECDERMSEDEFEVEAIVECEDSLKTVWMPEAKEELEMEVEEAIDENAQCQYKRSDPQQLLLKQIFFLGCYCNEAPADLEEKDAAETVSFLNPESLLKELVSVILDDLLGKVEHNMKVNVIHKQITCEKALQQHLISKRRSMYRLHFKQPWIARWLKRKALQRQRVTTSQKSIPPGDQVRKVVEGVQLTINEKKYCAENTLTADETGVFLAAT